MEHRFSANVLNRLSTDMNPQSSNVIINSKKYHRDSSGGIDKHIQQANGDAFQQNISLGGALRGN